MVRKEEEARGVGSERKAGKIWSQVVLILMMRQIDNGTEMDVGYVPPDFFAPRRLPGPSFAPFARPCDREVECRIAVTALRGVC